MMCFYRYIVTFYCEEEAKETTKTGITTAKSYPEAVEHLANYYGDDDIINFMCECIGADEVYECETMGMIPKFY